MAGADLYSLLKEYAQKTKSAFINKTSFINMLIVTAKYKSQKYSAWKDWTVRPREKFQYELAHLVAQNLVSIDLGESGELIVIPAYYTESVRELWAFVDGKYTEPFPQGESIKQKIPSHLIETSVFNDSIKDLVQKPQSEDFPVFDLIFPGTAGSMLILSSIIETRLLDMAIGKIAYFFSQGSNKEDFYKQITQKIPGYAAQTEALFNDLLFNTHECKMKMQNADAACFIIWQNICALIIETFADIKNPRGLEIALHQAAIVIDAFNNMYRDQAIAENDVYQLDILLEQYWEKEPYLYTIKMIWQFTDEAGTLLYERFSRDLVLTQVKHKAAISAGSVRLPDLLCFVDSETEKWYVTKYKLYEAFEIVCTENRHAVYKALYTHWHHLIKTYRNEIAMKNNEHFEHLVLKIASMETPVLAAIYDDTKFVLAKEELSSTDNTDIMKKFFTHDLRNPLPAILGFSRQGILRKIHAALPFWYSIPFLVAIIRFFKRV